MGTRLGRSMISMAIGGSIAVMAAASAAFASNPPARMPVLPPVVVTATPVTAQKAEPHPEIWAAIHSLEKARDHLDHAAHDYNGHRVDAIAAIDAALHQLHICLDYDR
jgi:hypothetical protein